MWILPFLDLSHLNQEMIKTCSFTCKTKYLEQQKIGKTTEDDFCKFITLLAMNLNGFYAVNIDKCIRPNFIQGGATNLPYPRTEK